jgi:hypothetical protein
MADERRRPVTGPFGPFARKGMVVVYDYVSSYTPLQGGPRTSYRLGVVESAHRNGNVAVIRELGGSIAYDGRRKSYGYRPVPSWWLVPELRAEDLPPARELHGWQGWPDLETAREALRPYRREA